jgi:methionyl-tRNA formyltransferase
LTRAGEGAAAPTAVAFAYHEVGVGCLGVLLEAGVDVRLVVTHEDDPGENVFFASVREAARARGLEVATPVDPNEPAFVRRVRAMAPDFIFSFYYRRMLSPALLAAARRGAYNMHGSLLPHYRGRAPVNWAVLRGERETGATLHGMVEKPDAGPIVGQERVPIGEDDTAGEVFARVTDAAIRVMRRELPRLIDGAATLTPQDLAKGGYFGARRPEDGRIDLAKSAKEVHDLVRAVAPPYPGAFLEHRGLRFMILRTRRLGQTAGGRAPGVRCEGGRVLLDCGDGATLEATEISRDGVAMTPQAFCDNYWS